MIYCTKSDDINHFTWMDKDNNQLECKFYEKSPARGM